MSFVGVRGFPDHNRQPSASQSTQPHPSPRPAHIRAPSSADVTHDSKDLLRDRLADLTRRLDTAELAEEDASLIHIHLHRLERVLRGKAGLGSPAVEERVLSPQGGREENGGLWDSPSTFGSPKRASFSSAGESRVLRAEGVRSHERRCSEMGEQSWAADKPESFTLVGSRGEMERNGTVSPGMKDVQFATGETGAALVQHLSAALEEVKARKVETEHIQRTLLSQCNANAQRISYLEDQFRDIKEDQDELLAKLSNLRLQLRALEVQGADHIPFNADVELSNSIRNWKLEWATVDMKSKLCKKRCSEVLVGKVVQSPPAAVESPHIDMPAVDTVRTPFGEDTDDEMF